MTFNELMKKDALNIVEGEFHQIATYIHNGVSTSVPIQYFEEPLDKSDTVYSHVWCTMDSIPDIAINDEFVISNVNYSVVDFSPDEHYIGCDIFLSKVVKL